MTVIEPLVSILIPLYNSENYISETLDSCLNQDYKNIEIVIVDDESTDSSYKICEIYSAKYDFIKLYKQKNSGAPIARNIAFERSQGAYIQYLDADDLLSVDKISNQINLLINESRSTISYTSYSRFSGSIENVLSNTTSVDYSNSIAFYNYLLRTGWLQTSCWLVPRDLIIKTGDWREDLTRNQDGDFFGRIILNSKKGIYSEEGNVFYRILNPNSISSKKRDVIYHESYIKSFYFCADYIIDNGSKEEKYQIAKVINGFCERLFLHKSSEVEVGRLKIVSLGFPDFSYLEHPIVKYLKKIIGYRNAILVKFKIVNIFGK